MNEKKKKKHTFYQAVHSILLSLKVGKWLWCIVLRVVRLLKFKYHFNQIQYSSLRTASNMQIKCRKQTQRCDSWKKKPFLLLNITYFFWIENFLTDWIANIKKTNKTPKKLSINNLNDVSEESIEHFIFNARKKNLKNLFFFFFVTIRFELSKSFVCNKTSTTDKLGWINTSFKKRFGF